MKKIHIIAIITISSVILYIIYSFIAYQKNKSNININLKSKDILYILCYKSDDNCIKISRKINTLGKYTINTVFVKNNPEYDINLLENYIIIDDSVRCYKISERECSKIRSLI